MRKYSRVNRGYKYIFTNIDDFSNMHGLFLLNQKLLDILNHVSKKYLNNENQNIFGLIKNQLFSLKKC